MMILYRGSVTEVPDDIGEKLIEYGEAVIAVPEKSRKRSRKVIKDEPERTDTE